MNNWELSPPEQRVTVRPSAEDVATRLIRALQNSDVAVVLTRSQLERLIQMVEPEWITDEDFEILKNLKKLREAHR